MRFMRVVSRAAFPSAQRGSLSHQVSEWAEPNGGAARRDPTPGDYMSESIPPPDRLLMPRNERFSLIELE